jgi:hypothetical protein
VEVCEEGKGVLDSEGVSHYFCVALKAFGLEKE